MVEQLEKSKVWNVFIEKTRFKILLETDSAFVDFSTKAETEKMRERRKKIFAESGEYSQTSY